MVIKRKSNTRRVRVDEIFSRNPILTLETLSEALGGQDKRSQARERARYYCKTGKLRLISRGLYAVVPPGLDPERFIPDPYLVAAALREDAVLSHHTALDLLGVSHSVFQRFPYLTKQPRRTLKYGGMEWQSVAHPTALNRASRTDFGIVTIDRRGVVIRATGPERTLVDGFNGLRWVGGLEELVESAGGFLHLELDRIEEYLGFIDKSILYAAIGWFLEKHLEVAEGAEDFLPILEKHIPKQPLYLDGRKKGGKLERRWNIIVPTQLSSSTSFEGVG